MSEEYRDLEQERIESERLRRERQEAAESFLAHKEGVAGERDWVKNPEKKLQDLHSGRPEFNPNLPFEPKHQETPKQEDPVKDLNGSLIRGQESVIDELDKRISGKHDASPFDSIEMISRLKPDEE